MCCQSNCIFTVEFNQWQCFTDEFNQFQLVTPIINGVEVLSTYDIRRDYMTPQVSRHDDVIPQVIYHDRMTPQVGRHDDVTSQVGRRNHVTPLFDEKQPKFVDVILHRRSNMTQLQLRMRRLDEFLITRHTRMEWVIGNETESRALGDGCLYTGSVDIITGSHIGHLLGSHATMSMCNGLVNHFNFFKN